MRSSSINIYIYISIYMCVFIYNMYSACIFVCIPILYFFPISRATPSCRKNQQYDCKWYVPLSELRLQAPEEAEPLAVPLVADEELDAVKLKISHLRSELQREKVSGGERLWVPGGGVWVLTPNCVSSSEPTRAARPRSV